MEIFLGSVINEISKKIASGISAIKRIEILYLTYTITATLWLL